MKAARFAVALGAVLAASGVVAGAGAGGDGDAARLRAEDLAEAATRRFSEVLVGEQRVAQAQPPASPGKPAAKKESSSDDPYAMLLNWLDHSNREYQSIMRRLALGDGPVSASKAPPPAPPAAAKPGPAPAPVIASKPKDATESSDWLTTSSRRFQSLMLRLSEAAAPPPKWDPVKEAEKRTIAKAPEPAKPQAPVPPQAAVPAAEKAKIAEAKPADTKKAGEAKKADEERRLAELRRGETKRAEEVKKTEEALKADQQKKAAEAKKVEEINKAAEARKAEEITKTDQLKRVADAKRAEELKKAAEAKAAEAKKAEDVKKADDARKTAEAKAAEAKKAEELKKAEDAKRAAEAKAAEAKKVADARKAEEDERRRIDERRQLKAKADAELTAKRAEEKRLAEQAARAVDHGAASQALKQVPGASGPPAAAKAQAPVKSVEAKTQDLKKAEAAKPTEPSAKAGDARKAGEARKPDESKRIATAKTIEAPAKAGEAGKATEPKSSMAKPAAPPSIAAARTVTRPERRSGPRTCEGFGTPIDGPGWYVIGERDTLWRIAQQHYGAGWRYKRIYAANRKRLRSPHILRPCQRVYLPGKMRRT